MFTLSSPCITYNTHHDKYSLVEGTYEGKQNH